MLWLWNREGVPEHVDVEAVITQWLAWRQYDDPVDCAWARSALRVIIHEAIAKGLVK